MMGRVHIFVYKDKAKVVNFSFLFPRKDGYLRESQQYHNYIILVSPPVLFPFFSENLKIVHPVCNE